MKVKALVGGVATVLAVSSSAFALQGTITVNTTSNADTTTDARCSLVEAMKAANGSGNYHECHASALGALTIALPSGAIASAQSLQPTKPLIIRGAGLTATTISFTANSNSGCGVLAFDGNNVTLQNLTIQQSAGLSLTGVCGRSSTGQSVPMITLNGVRIQSFQNAGVTIFAGTLAGTNVIVQNNSTSGSGGGIGIFSPGQMATITNLSLIGNTAGGWGGGLYRDTFVIGNTNIYNGTISGNQAPLGGGIFCGTDGEYLQVHDTVIASNHASISGGGIYVATNCQTGTPFQIDNSVVVSNSASTSGPNFYVDCPGFANSSYTLWGGPLDYVDNVGDGTGDKTIVQDTAGTVFFPLSNSGSPYFLPAYQPRPDSDARNMALCRGRVDVRGASRPQGPGCDSGAWEVP